LYQESGAENLLEGQSIMKWRYIGQTQKKGAIGLPISGDAALIIQEALARFPSDNLGISIWGVWDIVIIVF
jgi:hypothetical protein